MIQYGDRHNFGQQVKPIERASGTWFQKPRSVFWEHLFFGKDSPLKEYFSVIGENGDALLSKYFFNLEIENHNNWLGFARKIDSAPSSNVVPEKFYSFGALIAYCYALGIQDLHRFNTIETETHLQVVDVESVLSAMTLPNETLLLPFKSVGIENSAIGRLVPTYGALTMEQRQSIFTGYFDLIGVLVSSFNDVRNILRQAPKELPIRVILRSTKEYVEMLASNDLPEDLLEEEREQLSRNDIPYFFKFIGDARLYWIHEARPEMLIRNVQCVSQFSNDFNRYAVTADVLFGEKSDLENKMYRGAVFLLKKLGVPQVFQIDYLSEELKIQSNEINFAKKNLKLTYS